MITLKRFVKKFKPDLDIFREALKGNSIYVYIEGRAYMSLPNAVKIMQISKNYLKWYSQYYLGVVASEKGIFRNSINPMSLISPENKKAISKIIKLI